MTTTQIIGVSIFSVLIVQWIFAFICLMRLYKNKPTTLKTGWWNIIILFGIIIGPVCYLLIERSNPRVQNSGVSVENTTSSSQENSGKVCEIDQKTNETSTCNENLQQKDIDETDNYII